MDRRYLTQEALADLATVPATSRWVVTNSLALHVLDYNAAPAVPPLLVLPGITSPAITMNFVAVELTDIAHPYVVDIRGRGLSDSATSYTLDDYAEDVEAIVDDLALDDVSILGHSMGARIAAVVAARGRVPLRSLLLADPPMSGPGRGPYPTTFETFLAQLAEARAGTTTAEVAKAWPRWPQSEQRLRAHWLSSCDVEAVSQTHRGFEEDDFFDVWPKLTSTTTLIYGSDSPMVPADGVEHARSMNPQANLETIPDAGHMLFWDNPAPALASVRRALSGSK
ncbi:alpha/beta fold hydrolase [Mycolicibacterium smegmatis]|uniref:Non-heme bromoperoxidase BPO-A2 n=1 Tax=Mycolicibacterium smegmatis (strain MKD8) TaxID=1214915 RepID=A0A2U9PKP3_MYCSE|nr:alpha/beta hydrolase [Mycolicibacterium smegmatis]AWT52313.1 non-heme bromoperoxidase BPO-A2 [Mycolicibacterium smegmatis MKD8]